MKTDELLANVRVASPCTARWSHMVGDNHARFRSQCEKHVYNLSDLTSAEAASLIRRKEGKLCARFYRRADGMILTTDCPVGAAQVWLRLKRLIGAAAGFMAISLAIVPAESTDADSPRTRAKVFQAWDEALATTKVWLGLAPTLQPTMGIVCVPPPGTSKAASPPPSNSNFGQ